MLTALCKCFFHRSFSVVQLFHIPRAVIPCCIFHLFFLYFIRTVYWSPFVFFFTFHLFLSPFFVAYQYPWYVLQTCIVFVFVPTILTKLASLQSCARLRHRFVSSQWTLIILHFEFRPMHFGQITPYKSVSGGTNKFLIIFITVKAATEQCFVLLHCRYNSSKHHCFIAELGTAEMSIHRGQWRTDCAVLCCAVPCCVVLCRAMLCLAVPCCVVPCCVVLCLAVPCRVVLCRAVLCCVVPCRAVLCCAVPCCVVPCRVHTFRALFSSSDLSRR
jgi:hypothetical protein